MGFFGNNPLKGADNFPEPPSFENNKSSHGRNMEGKAQPELPVGNYENVDLEMEKKRITERIGELQKMLDEDPGDADSSFELSELVEKLNNLENPIGKDY